MTKHWRDDAGKIIRAGGAVTRCPDCPCEAVIGLCDNTVNPNDYKATVTGSFEFCDDVFANCHSRDFTGDYTQSLGYLWNKEPITSGRFTCDPINDFLEPFAVEVNCFFGTIALTVVMDWWGGVGPVNIARITGVTVQPNVNYILTPLTAPIFLGGANRDRPCIVASASVIFTHV